MAISYAQDDLTIFNPMAESECYKLDSPIESLMLDDGLYVITYNFDLSKNVLLYPDGTIKDNFFSLSQIKAFDDSHILIGDNGSIYVYRLSDGQTFDIKDSIQNKNIGSTFDYNNNYLLTSYKKDLYAYTLEYDEEAGNYKATLRNQKITVYDDCSVAINSKDEIFYVTSNKEIYKNNISNTNPEKLVENVLPTKIIANDNYLFYIDGSAICSVRLSDKAITRYTIEADANYELGKTYTPVGLSFRGENILITDSELNAVSEFLVDNDKLIFTGYAVASGKKAYNRISLTPIDIERYGDYVAVLDEYKLTIINQGIDNYLVDKYTNLFVGSAPMSFALGKETLLTYDGENVKLFNYKGEEIICDSSQPGEKHFEGYVKDICYQNGKYYFISSVQSDTYLYSVDESAHHFNKEKAFGEKAYTVMTVDVFGNFTFFPLANNITKLCTDLVGNVYGLKDGKIYLVQGNTLIPTTFAQDKIKSFTINFDRKECYIISQNSEIIHSTTTLDNKAINAISVPENFLTYNTAVEDIKSYYVLDGENRNIYNVKINGENFEFIDIIDKESEYILIGEDEDLFYFTSHNGLTIVNKNDVEEKSLTTDENTGTAYIATKVRMYVLPQIDKENYFTLTVNEVTHLQRGEKIEVIKTITFLDKVFYFANITIDDTTIKAYIPQSFTVSILTENKDMLIYSVEEKVKGAIYSDKELQNKIAVLNNQTVLVFSTENNIARVKVLINDEWVEGYVSKTSFSKVAKTSTRNILAVLAVIACVSGTASFFILRNKSSKKKY